MDDYDLAKLERAHAERLGLLGRWVRIREAQVTGALGFSLRSERR